MTELVETTDIRYWVNIVALEHVQKSVTEGFVQAAKGQATFAEGDYVVFYSPRTRFRNGKQLQEFTAMGIVKSLMGEDEKAKTPTPPRYEMQFFSSRRAHIEPLVSDLSFLPDKEKWELPYSRGAFSICKEDYSRIAEAMARSAGESVEESS